LGLSAGSVVQLIVDGADEALAADNLEQLIADLEVKGV
jgi:phosphotransferase system HPr-like phosphotransfer protein